jgi:hypothetical protein
MLERRTFKRHKRQSSINWNSEEVRFEGITHDICPGGVFIITGTSQLLPPKSIIELELWISDKAVPISSRCEVVWTNYGQLVCYPPGFGVRFLDLQEDSVERLIRLCEEADVD